MSFSWVFASLLVISAVCQGYAQISNSTQILCYDCDPKNNPEQCLDPVRNGVQQTNCNVKYNSSQVICLSSYVYFGDNDPNTGIYRGCYQQDSSIVSFCDWFQQETETVHRATVVSCVPCNSTRCNSATFDATGQLNGSNLFRGLFLVIAASFMFSVLF